MATEDGSVDFHSPGHARMALRTVRVLILILMILVPAAAAGLVLAATKGRDQGARYTYRRMTVLLMRLGPTFIKAGQVIGTRRDVLPPLLCDELSTLQDSVPPLTARQAQQALDAAYGCVANGRFEHVEYLAVASGSVACVYRARLHSGDEVALKLRRPGIERTMVLDLSLMRAGAGLVARLPVLRGVPVTPVVEQVCAAVFGQLDFEREADSLQLLRENLASVPRIWVPKVKTELSGPSCIAMEFIPGLELDTAQRCSAAVKKRFAASALTAIYHMLFVDGFVHCDMHPGNLYFTQRGQVVVLDAGFSVRLTDRLRRLFAEFFMHMSAGEGTRCAEIVIESAEGTRPDADLDGFLVRMAELVERNHRVPAKDFSLIEFAAEMFDLQRAHGVHAAPELIFPLLSLLVIEGTIRELDPDMDFQETARPVLMRGLFGQR
jgi:ubiquinone biosynthesis protein